MRILLTTVLSVGLHLTFGWEWTILAGFFGGVWSPRFLRGSLVGGAGTALGWALLVIYTAAVAPSSLRLLVDTLGGLAGNIAGEVVVGTTVLLGGGLGALGGVLGATLSPLFKRVFPIDSLFSLYVSGTSQ